MKVISIHRIFSILLLLIFFSACKHTKKPEFQNNILKKRAPGVDTILVDSLKNNLFFDSIKRKYVYISTDKKNIKYPVKNKDYYFWKVFKDSSGKIKKKVNIYIPKKHSDANINQIIYYDERGNIDYNKSLFFNIEKKDTLSIGRNVLEINYFNKKFDSIKTLGYDPHFVLEVITYNNEYPGNKITNDTLHFDVEENGKFKGFIGVYRSKPGETTVKGKLHLMIYYIQPYKNDSTIFNKVIFEHYFNKKLYIKDTIRE